MTDEERAVLQNVIDGEIAREHQRLLRVIAKEIRYQETLFKDARSDDRRNYHAGKAAGLRWVYGLIENP